jgi:hypothetical protein
LSAVSHDLPGVRCVGGTTATCDSKAIAYSTEGRRMTITDIGSDSSEGVGVNEPHVSDAVSADAPDGRAITSDRGCDSVCEDLHEQGWPPEDGALPDPPQQPQPMLPGLEGC